MKELIIKKPRITEKAGIQAEQFNVFTFEVTDLANKKNIIKAVKDIYKVPTKVIISSGKMGKKSGVKKALVYLKTGDKIEFV